MCTMYTSMSLLFLIFSERTNIKSKDIITAKAFDLMNRITDRCIIARSYMFLYILVNQYFSIIYYYFFHSYHTWHDNILFINQEIFFFFIYI